MTMTTAAEDEPSAERPEPRRPEPPRAAELATELERATQGLRELDHRIKNDLQLITSVFLLQMRRLAPGPERELVREALARVNAVAAVHRRLDPRRDVTRLEAAGLIRDLVTETVGEAGREDIRVELALEPLTIPARQAAPLALIGGELVRNALTHGFPQAGGSVQVELRATDGTLIFAVQDDGAGLPDAGRPEGFGLMLVSLLAQQLRGRFEIAAAGRGVRAAVQFPETP